MPIRVLSEEVIAQIAAGEVVERPAAVVKELVENSLDAGATQVAVEVKAGGVALIRVSDDGSGIKADEIGAVFQRHATSKISNLADLEAIHTFGFRGEALASIAAAAEVEVVTCATGETAGTSLRLENGAVAKRGEQGRARGTTITVRDLFRKVPARLKFLKSTASESSRVANVVSQYALAFPEVRFSLVIDGRAALQTPGLGHLIDSLVAVYGAALAGRMLEVKRREGEWQSGPETITVTGLVSAPSVGRSSRANLSFFVNRRWVNSRALSWAVEEAYQGLLMTGKHPLAVINISVPPGEVDVNIHPAKSEVRFQNESAVFAAVQKAVRRTIVAQMPAPGIEEVSAPYRPAAKGIEELFAPAVERPTAMVPLAKTLPLAMQLPVLRVIGQVARMYIVAEGPDGLYIIDQHAAHERVLFEKVRGEQSRLGTESQSLLEAATFEVSPAQEAVLRSRYHDLAGFGFIIEPFGDRAYLVRAVPVVLHGKDWAATLRELADALAGEGAGGWEERVAASIACHGAVRSGQVLSDDEMRGLVRQLEGVVNPHTCPHGRPTMLHLGPAQMEREFGRRG